MSTIRFQLHGIQFKKENGFEIYFPNHTIFSLIIGFHLGRHLGYIEMLNDARVASLGFLKDNICTTRINKEKKFKIKFQVLLKFAQILPDYYRLLHENQLTVMCTTRGERRFISIRCQKECVESKLVISCRMMHHWSKAYRGFKSYEHFH